MKKFPNDADDLDFPWDENACEKEKMTVKEDPEYNFNPEFDYFKFLEQFPPHPEELQEVKIFNNPFTLPE